VLLMTTPQPLPLLPAGPSLARRTVLSRRVRLLVAATTAYNVVEAVVATIAGTLASSTALIVFGLDSIIEVASAATVAWQFSSTDHERRERTALRIIAVSFFALAAYVSVESVRALLGTDRTEHSTVGLVLAAVSLAVMPVLSAAQRRAGRNSGRRRRLPTPSRLCCAPTCPRYCWWAWQ
jgi:divalent metal cation (Fe/Co/Zn/Cd) transporter